MPLTPWEVLVNHSCHPEASEEPNLSANAFAGLKAMEDRHAAEAAEPADSTSSQADEAWLTIYIIACIWAYGGICWYWLNRYLGTSMVYIRDMEFRWLVFWFPEFSIQISRYFKIIPQHSKLMIPKIYHDHPWSHLLPEILDQTKKKLRKFLESMIQKSGKIRSLVREIADVYSKSDVLQKSSSQSLETFHLFANMLRTVCFGPSPNYRSTPRAAWGPSASWRTNSRNLMASTMSATMWWPRVRWMDLGRSDGLRKIVNIYIYILYQQITFSCTCMGFNVCTYHKNGVLDSTHLWNHADEVRDPSHDRHEQCDIHVWASWQFVPLFMRIHIYTIYIYIDCIFMSTWHDFVQVENCWHMPTMAQVLNGLRSGSKDEVLTSAHQRHAQCPTYILAIFSRNAKRYEKKDADLPGSPPVKKEKKDKTDKRDSKSVKTKNERANRMRAQSPKFPSRRSPRKTSDVLTRADHFLIFGMDCRYIGQSFFVGTPNKFVSPEGTCRSPATDMKQDSTCGTCSILDSSMSVFGRPSKTHPPIYVLGTVHSVN